MHIEWCSKSNAWLWVLDSLTSCRFHTIMLQGSMLAGFLGKRTRILGLSWPPGRGDLPVEPDEDHGAVWGQGGAAVPRHCLFCLWIIAGGQLTGTDFDGAIQPRHHQLTRCSKRCHMVHMPGGKVLQKVPHVVVHMPSVISHVEANDDRLVAVGFFVCLYHISDYIRPGVLDYCMGSWTAWSLERQSFAASIVCHSI